MQQEYCEKRLIPNCLLIHKILSKKNTSMLIMPQMRILRIRKTQCESF